MYAAMIPLECERGTTGEGPGTGPAAGADDAAPPPSDSAWFLNTLMASSSLSSIRDVACLTFIFFSLKRNIKYKLEIPFN